MALILGCIDADADRRTRCAAELADGLGELSWLRSGVFSHGDLALAWRAAPSAPVGIARRDDGAAAFVLGTLAKAREEGIAPAELLLDVADRKGGAAISGLNGYYFGLCREADGTVWMAVDLLGYFPLYWCSCGNVLLFASAPGLLRRHPAFRPEPCPRGIAGVLLTMHMVGNQTVWKGVRRLPSGSVLRRRSGHGAEECRAERLEPSDRYAGCTQAHANDVFDGALSAAVRGAAGEQPFSMMLSGGLDSRLVAAYAHEVRPGDVVAVTFGRTGDYEMDCASQVARTLGWRHETRDIDYATFERWARLQAELEQLSGSFVDFAWGTGFEVFARLGRRVLNGFVGDPVMGASHADWAFDPATGTYTFDALLARIRRYGLAPGEVRALLRRDFFGEAVEDALDALRDTFEHMPGEPWQKGWMFDLLHRQRFHVASFAWRLALAAWPELPYIDRRVLETAAGMPLERIRGRRVQRELLARRFPLLARLPLDTNSRRMSLVTATWRGRIRVWFEATRFARRVVHRSAERRYYFRVYNIHNPGWDAVRRAAESGRHAVHAMFDAEQLARMLPPPGVRIDARDAIIDGSRYKSLLGLMLLAAPRQ